MTAATKNPSLKSERPWVVIKPHQFPDRQVLERRFPALGHEPKLRSLGLGVFMAPPEATGGGGDELVGKLMGVLIEARAEARSAKQFALADLIRDRLTEAGVALEDRADGTTWQVTRG